MITENLSTLKIHKLTQTQYDRELEAGRIDESALYLTPDEEIDLSGYVTTEQLATKADSTHTHTASQIADVDWMATSEEHIATTVVIPEQTVSTTWSNLQYLLQPGIVYDVYVNGIVYECTAISNDSAVILGNHSLMSSSSTLPNNNEPFCIYWAGGSATMGMFYKDTERLTAPITIKVMEHGSYVVYNKLPEEFLPDSLQIQLNEITESKADFNHTHTVSTITDLTATATELNYMDGVTSNVQEQLDTKAETSDLGFTRIVACTSSDGVVYTGTTDGITALTAGLTIVFVSSKTSASTTPTLNINSLGAKNIKRRLSHLSTSTQAGYSTTWLFANKPYLLVYDGTQWIVDGLTKPSAADLYGTLQIEKGGTGANTAEQARANLGVAPTIQYGTDEVTDGAASSYPEGTLYVVIE